MHILIPNIRLLNVQYTGMVRGYINYRSLFKLRTGTVHYLYFISQMDGRSTRAA
jgi:hypothetical protein